MRQRERNPTCFALAHPAGSGRTHSKLSGFLVTTIGVAGRPIMSELRGRACKFHRYLSNLFDPGEASNQSASDSSAPHREHSATLELESVFCGRDPIVSGTLATGRVALPATLEGPRVALG